MTSIRDFMVQHFCSPARPELPRNRPTRTVYPKQKIIFWPGPDRDLLYNLTSKAK